MPKPDLRKPEKNAKPELNSGVRYDSEPQRQLIDVAATLLRKSRNRFIMDAATASARETLMERGLDPEAILEGAA